MDGPQILVRHHTPEQFRDFIVGQFEELLRLSAKQPLVCGIALHTMIMGSPIACGCCASRCSTSPAIRRRTRCGSRSRRRSTTLCRAAQGYDAAAGYFLNWNSGSFLSASLDAPASVI